MGQVTPFQRRSYKAQTQTVRASGLEFWISGTLDGFLDFCVIDSSGAHLTYNITCDDARRLAAALNSAVHDVQTNCLFDADRLLERR